MLGKRFFFGYIIFILFLICVPRFSLYFDIPEYVEIVANNSFLNSLFLGHPPIHPVFNGFLWVITHFLNLLMGVTYYYGANIFAFLISLGSVGVAGLIFNKFIPKLWQWGLTLFCLTPLFFLISTNLFVESLTIFWYLLLSYLSLKYWEYSNPKLGRGIILVVVLGFLTHLEIVFWLPSILAMCLLLPSSSNFSKSFIKLVMLYGAGLVLSILIYLGLMYFKNPVATEDLGKIFQIIFNLTFTQNALLDIGRAFRNIFVSVTTGFGLGFLIILGWILIKNFRQKNLLWAYILFGISVFLSGNLWWSDLMARRVVFAGLFIFLVITKYFGKHVKWLVIYSVLLLTPVLITNSEFLGKPPIVLMNQMEKNLPGASTLIQSQYLRPFVADNQNNVILLGVNNFSWEEVKGSLFMDSQAIFAPYLLYVGNNLHPTSLTKTGESEGKDIITGNYYNLYSVGSAKDRIFSYQLFSDYVSVDQRKTKLTALVDQDTIVVWGESTPGATIVIYSNKLIDRLQLRRLNYSDPFSWITSYVTNQKDPIFWTYADKSGYFAFPLSRRLLNDFYIDSTESFSCEVIE